MCVCVHDNSKNNGSIDLKLEHIVVHENSSDEFDIGHCPIKVKVTGCYISALAHIRMLILNIYVLLECINTICKHSHAWVV